jgi:micrococcal nuclease
MRASLLLLVASAWCAAAAAETLSGKVVAVADGDTVTVLVDGHKQVKVRLHGVDCPERGQPFGNRAKQFTSEMCFGKSVTVQVSDTDRFGRAIGEVTTANGTNVNVALVENGLGWWYEKYAPGDARFRDAQQQARAAARGLWSERGAVPPWEYRSRNRADSTGARTAAPDPGEQGLDATQGTHWLTRSSNKRHNSKCQMYRNTNGRLCGPDEGVPCKRCGG